LAHIHLLRRLVPARNRVQGFKNSPVLIGLNPGLRRARLGEVGDSRGPQVFDPRLDLFGFLCRPQRVNLRSSILRLGLV